MCETVPKNEQSTPKLLYFTDVIKYLRSIIGMGSFARIFCQNFMENNSHCLCNNTTTQQATKLIKISEAKLSKNLTT